jgi:hypothetical protein
MSCSILLLSRPSEVSEVLFSTNQVIEPTVIANFGFRSTFHLKLAKVSDYLLH